MEKSESRAGGGDNPRPPAIRGDESGTGEQSWIPPDWKAPRAKAGDRGILGREGERRGARPDWRDDSTAELGGTASGRYLPDPVKRLQPLRPGSRYHRPGRRSARALPLGWQYRRSRYLLRYGPRSTAHRPRCHPTRDDQVV